MIARDIANCRPAKALVGALTRIRLMGARAVDRFGASLTKPDARTGPSAVSRTILGALVAVGRRFTLVAIGRRFAWLLLVDASLYLLLADALLRLPLAEA